MMVEPRPASEGEEEPVSRASWGGWIEYPGSPSSARTSKIKPKLSPFSKLAVVTRSRRTKVALGGTENSSGLTIPSSTNQSNDRTEISIVSTTKKRRVVETRDASEMTIVAIQDEWPPKLRGTECMKHEA